MELGLMHRCKNTYDRRYSLNAGLDLGDHRHILRIWSLFCIDMVLLYYVDMNTIMMGPLILNEQAFDVD